MDLYLGMSIGFALGSGLVFALTRGQIRQAYERGEASTVGELATLGERLASRDREVERLERELSDLGVRAESVTTELRAQTTANARLGAELESERKAAAEKLALIADAEAQLKNAFEALSGQALQANNRMFLDLAQQALGKYQQGAQGDLEKRQQAIAELVAPVKQSLDKLDGCIQGIEKAREGAYSSLTTQVQLLHQGQGDLRRETSSLVKALRQPAARGRWGELQLRRVVEMAGMLSHCDFVEQVSVTGDDGRMRPDLVVRMPGGANIVVDAKAPLAAYLEAIDTEDEDARRLLLVDHARQVRDHMTRLGRKAYQDQFDTSPDLVVLFLPGEMLFSSALQHDPGLIEYGAGEKVLVATPTTLIALLRAIACGWKQEALARNAREISDLGRQLYERISTLAGHWAKVGKNLGDAVGAYNSAVASMETRVLVSARRFKDLDAVPDDRTIIDVAQVEVLPRTVQASEMQMEAAA